MTNQPSIEPSTLDDALALLERYAEYEQNNFGEHRVTTATLTVIAALRASEERIKKLEVRINAVFGLLNSAFEEQESLLKNDYLFSAFSHVFPVTTPTEE